GQQGPVECDGGDYRVDTGAIGQTGVDERARLIDATPDPTDDAIDDAAQVRLVAELRVDRVDPALTLDVDAVRPVDHDLSDLGVPKEGLDRAMAEDLIRDFLRDPGSVPLR